MKKDLLSLADVTADELWHLIKAALALQAEGRRPLLAGRSLALIFEKPSLRTRVSFDIAMNHLGGHALYLSPAEVGLGKREAVADVARVLSRYVYGIVGRTFTHRDVDALAQYATVPVINGLSDEEHPCQALSDLLTIYEKKGELAYVGNQNAGRFADFILDADVRLVSGPNQNAFGMIFRVQDSQQDFYFFKVTANGYYVVGKRLNGIPQVILNKESEYLQKGYNTNHLTVV